ncbi:MAG: lipolytic protein family [Bacteroidetes bacterium]|nr:lipolytic protein family [Bacteroidota bacterium]
MKTLCIAFLTAVFLHLPTMEKNKYAYVALGDSYTIGTGTTPENSWPVLLSKHLSESGISIVLEANPAHNGWTTKDVIERELPVFESSSPSFTTLLIGVNDWVQGMDEKTFRKNLVYIIEKVQAKLPDKSKFVLITIPDFGVTPTGAMYSNGRDISKGIAEFNKIILEEAKKRDLKTADLYAQSKEMGKDRSLVADDGLHPSAKGYATWEKLIFPVVYGVLK